MVQTTTGLAVSAVDGDRLAVTDDGLGFTAHPAYAALLSQALGWINIGCHPVLGDQRLEQVAAADLSLRPGEMRPAGTGRHPDEFLLPLHLAQSSTFALSTRSAFE